MTKDESDKLLKESEAAKILGVSLSWLQKGRCQHYGPPSISLRPKGAVRYRLSELREYLERNTTRPDVHRPQR
jgi:predicted DNA-binding transcriptional regulator AlpA